MVIYFDWQLLPIVSNFIGSSLIHDIFSPLRPITSCLYDGKYERHDAYLQDVSIQFDFEVSAYLLGEGGGVG